jgi:hypothetical protein
MVERFVGTLIGMEDGVFGFEDEEGFGSLAGSVEEAGFHADEAAIESALKGFIQGDG